MSPFDDSAPSRLVVEEAHAGLRADAYLSLRLPFLSRTRVRQKIQMGESLLNGRRYATCTRLAAGDVLLVFWRSPPSTGPLPSLDVLYEDETLLAVDKPAGVASHPMGRTQQGTVVQWARARYERQIRESLGRGDGSLYPTLVNRLDVFTSGIVLLALTRASHAAFQNLMTRRGIEKEYLALVEGAIDGEEGTIDLAIGPDLASEVRVKMAARGDGQPSLTSYSVVRRLPGCTLLAVLPRTGRQHQIRVHFAAIGHPVLGDLLYKDERLFLRYQSERGLGGVTVPTRHFLHAARISFTHPTSGAAITIRSPLPVDFRALLDSLGTGP